MTGPKITVGNVEIIALVDMPFELPWAMMFPNRDQAEIEPYQKMYPRSNGKAGFQTQAGAYAIRSQGKTDHLRYGLSVPGRSSSSVGHAADCWTTCGTRASTR